MAQSFVSFRNVGTRQFETRLVSVVSQSSTPIGFVMPMMFGNTQDLFLMNYNLQDEIQNNLKNLLLTNHGERVVLFDYGANLRPLLTEFVNVESFDEEAMIRINTVVTKYMPFIQLEGFRSEAQYENNQFVGVVQIMVQYSVPRAGIGLRTLEITLNPI